MRRVPTPTDRGQSETLGVVLILGITIAGTGLLVGFGATMLDDTRSSTQLHQAELAMTVFDSRAATVALGDSDVQTVDFGGTSGTMNVKPNSGQITVKHVNWSEDNDYNETIYQGSLGALVYENDGTKLVYQAGGVWRMEEGGGVSMVSPPEFHYRGATLTLPLIRVTGSAAGSASSKVKVVPGSDMEHVYPNTSRHYDGDGDGDGDDGQPKYTNPAENGHVRLVIESEYYQGWASYFRERTNAKVNVSEEDEKVVVKLLSTGKTGYFEMPGEDSSVNVRGVGNHGMSDFEVTLRPDDADSADFNNLKWSMYVDKGPTQFELHVRKSGDDGNCNVNASVSVYYSTDDGNTYHGWYAEDAFQSECGDFDDDGDEEIRMVLDFVDDEPNESDDPKLDYQSLSSKQTMEFDPSNSELNSSVRFDGHDVTWEPKTYPTDDSTESLDRLLNHYFSELGDFDLTVGDKSSNTVNEGASYGTIDYGGGGKYITYLHITENEVRIETN